MNYLTQDLADEYQMEVQPRKKTVEDMLFDLNAASNDDRKIFLVDKAV